MSDDQAEFQLEWALNYIAARYGTSGCTAGWHEAGALVPASYEPPASGLVVRCLAEGELRGLSSLHGHDPDPG